MKYLSIIGYFAILFLILPISLGIFSAYLLFPVVQFFYKKLHIPFLISIFLVTISFFYLTYQVSAVLIQSLLTFIPHIKMHLDAFSTNYADIIFFPLILEKSLSMMDTIIMSILNVAQQIFSYLFEFFVFIVAFYFALFESRKDRMWFFVYVPKQYRDEWKRYFKRAMSIFSYFIYVELQLFSLTFILLSSGFWLLQFENPISKALLISLADALPFFGIGLFIIPAAVYFFVIGQKWLAASLIALYIFIQITRQLTESIVWASTFQLRTVHSFIISAASILLFGIYGILLSPFLLLIAVKVKENSIFAR
ncbi:AI-2E family transporter [Solibacillus sp. CAU 1738]|uniref:AI-2E family transporter n=1 Tax=Solibacillus sp. CAU 1738 TaxID=3140363 RepID=UPI003260742B